MIQHCEFDTILHEHVFYHTLHGLTPLFKRHGLYLNDVERLPIHGGSLRLTVSRSPARSQNWMRFLLTRQRWAWITSFSIKISPTESGRFATRLQLARLREANGKRIACYGAAAKGATMVNYLNLGEGFFEFVADANAYKQGKYMPGQRIPIRHPDQLVAHQPDYVLLLAWNFAASDATAGDLSRTWRQLHHPGS